MDRKVGRETDIQSLAKLTNVFWVYFEDGIWIEVYRGEIEIFWTYKHNL